MSLWDKEGIPHKGWTCDEMIDLGEDAEDIDFDTRKAEFYEQCEMCSQEGIRYIHIMKHPQYNGQLRVGRICAEKMENDYIVPKERERELINRHNRKINFLKKEWKFNKNNNLVLKYKGKYITIMKSKYHKDEYGIAYDGNYIWNYKNNKIKDIKTAKLAAFDIFDSI